MNQKRRSMTISFLLLCIALSTDTFTAGLSYSAGRVRVPFTSMCIISVISGFMFTLSLHAGKILTAFIPAKLTCILSFIILFLLALYKLYDALPDSFHRRHNLTTASFSEKVNKKDIQILSSGEAALLSVVLSIDSITAGISSETPLLPPAIIFFISTAIHFLTMALGLSAGKLLLQKISYNFSWLSAVLFFILAFTRLF